jgi:hypothetical protein
MTRTLAVRYEQSQVCKLGVSKLSQNIRRIVLPHQGINGDNDEDGTATRPCYTFIHRFAASIPHLSQGDGHLDCEQEISGFALAPVSW